MVARADPGSVMTSSRLFPILLVAPALAIVALLFVYPLIYSIATAFQDRSGAWTLANFVTAWSFYARDIGFTAAIVLLSTALVGGVAVAIGGYLVLGTTRWAVAALAWLYRWPLFVPFIIAAQCMRTFLAKNGMMNNSLIAAGLMPPEAAQGLLDWRGIVITFVWKQAPFATLMVAGAMAALDRGTIDAARNLGASRLRILLEIIVPQVRPTLMVALILSCVTMMSVLSVPLMLSGQSPTMMTVQMAYRINQHGDYGVANALGLISYLMTAVVAWIYLRETMRERAA
jgi:ABC-type spermidine/putrescine transport system permease subunit I